MPRQCASLVAASLVLVATTLTPLPPAHASQDTPKAAQHANLSGLHDFDFLVGTWTVHHRHLKDRLLGSHAWTEFDGTFAFHPLMDGWANVDESILRLPEGEVRGVGLGAYDPATGEWANWWLDLRNPLGKLDPPSKGKFEKGVGTFYADDTLRDKPIRIRVVWSGITPTSVHWEQAFSGDGGKSWETNWITDFRKVSASPVSAAGAKSAPGGDLAGVHGFDHRVGRWETRHRKLKERLAGSTEWIDFAGSCNFFLLLGGAANVSENVFRMPDGDLRGVSLRSYDPQSGKWAIWWLDGRNPTGALDPPVQGKFEDGVGTFYADDTLRGKPIRVRFLWSQATPDAGRWEQAFSPDGGTTWETNWITDFRKVR